MDEDESFRISLAGAQEKTALLFWKDRWHAPRGATPTTHILKPQIGLPANGIDMTQSVENEYLCMKLAAAFGLPTAEVEIADFDGRRTLVVKRFDRLWTKDRRLLRVPQEDCCQALSVPPTVKYQADGGPGVDSILELLKASDEPETDRGLFLKAQIMFWLLGATDGHAKNFSLLLGPGGRFQLAPLYNVLSAQPAYDADSLSRNRMKLAMSVGDSRHYAIYGILRRRFIQTARTNGISEAAIQSIFDAILASENAIDQVVDSLPEGFSGALAESIVGGVRRRLRSLEAANAGSSGASYGRSRRRGRSHAAAFFQPGRSERRP
jgi:serine/threonine-protein kinase HipA